MCTVTYIPSGKNEFTLTQNRDESPLRNTHELVKVSRGGKKLLFPKDPLAGGTWIAVSDSGQLVSILNGAFDKHKHRPPYRKSRGVMALEFFDFKHAGQFFQNYNFKAIEPFTMLIYDNGKLYDFRWDERLKYVEDLEPGRPHLWASSTLYTNEAKRKRKLWFDAWQKDRTDFSRNAILNFHRTAGDGDPENDLIMNRSNIVRTTSITSITKSHEAFDVYFSDLMSGKAATDNLQTR